ncbi:phosphatase 2C-like domain-containing protein [Melampsora americana]|nr:phosphatase 2C-like domain-containing protein [Melampsora americana]
MGVPGSRASLISFASLKSSKSTKESNLNLLFRIKPSTFNTNTPTNPNPKTITRTLLTTTSNSNHSTTPFFDPSFSDCSTSILSIPSPQASTSSPSSPPSSSPSNLSSSSSSSSSSSTTTTQPRSNQSQPPVTRLSSSTGSSHDSNQISSNLLSSSSSSSIRSTNLSPLSPLNLYGHPITHPSYPSQSIRQKKHYYSFTNAASGIPKTSSKSLGSFDESYNFKILNSRPSSRLSTNHDLSVQIGEDAYFLRNDSLGVADGVGGWSGKPGANSAWFSNKLMHHCSFELSRYEDTEDEVFSDHQSIDPVEILQRAYEKSLNESKQEGIIGSTTALVAILRDDELRIANLGDCCCSIIRGNDYIFRSEEQQHSFNYPVQIGTNSKSTPFKHAQRYNIKVQKDDIVILSSDGLVDNLFDEDILEEVMKIKPFLPEKVSEALALRAKTVSIDQFAVTSPFSQRANEEGIHYVGGKNDDISVVVAVVRDL